jgi:hypothetical protein
MRHCRRWQRVCRLGLTRRSPAVRQEVTELTVRSRRQARQHVLQVRPRLGTQALAYYRQLYELERAAKDFTDAGRLQLRQDLAAC